MICDHDFSKVFDPKAMAKLATVKKIDVPKTCKVFRESRTSTHVLIRDEESKTIAYYTPKSDWPTTPNLIGTVSLRRRAGKKEVAIKIAKDSAWLLSQAVITACAIVLLPVGITVLVLLLLFAPHLVMSDD
jgi:hypothetical protein